MSESNIRCRREGAVDSDPVPEKADSSSTGDATPTKARMPAARLRELSPLSFCCSRDQLVRKLFTKEDPLYLHKTFGIICLLSFILRYGYIYMRKGVLGLLDGDLFDWVTMAVHLGLSSSSMIFHVLAKRIVSRPFIIWNEYRLHAIVFTVRCCSVFAWGVLRPFSAWPTLERVLLPAFVLAHHVVADEITKHFGPDDKSQTTVRTDGKSGPVTKAILRGYSFYQFAALGSHLLPHARLADLGFNTLIAIQSSAFLMTLFRKGLIRYYSHGVWYTGCLLLSAYHIHVAIAAEASPSATFWFWLKVLGAFNVRIRTGYSKYAIWAAFVFVSMPQVEAAVWDTCTAMLALLPSYAGSLAAISASASAAGSYSWRPLASRVNSAAGQLTGMLPSLTMPSMPDVGVPELPALSAATREAVNKMAAGVGEKMGQWGQALPSWDQVHLGMPDGMSSITELKLYAQQGLSYERSARALQVWLGGVGSATWFVIFVALAAAVALPGRRNLLSNAREWLRVTGSV